MTFFLLLSEKRFLEEGEDVMTSLFDFHLSTQK